MLIECYKLPVVMVLNLSWPANFQYELDDYLIRYIYMLPVSQICNLILLPSNSIVLILKSIPIVVMKEGVNESSENRNRRQLFPTPKKERVIELEVINVIKS